MLGLAGTKVMIYMYVIPLFAVVVAFFFLNEPVHLQQIIGGIVIFAGLWLVKKQPTSQKGGKIQYMDRDIRN